MFSRVVATSGWSGPKAFSCISRARTKSGSACKDQPWVLYDTARLFRLVATSGWSGPAVFSATCNASCATSTARS